MAATRALSSAQSPALPRRRDVRPRALLVLVAGGLALGVLVNALPGRGIVARVPESRQPLGSGFDGLRAGEPAAKTPAETPAGENPAPVADRNSRIKALLKEATAHTAAQRYNQALATLNQLRPLAPELPEAYLRIGEALLGRKDYDTARDFFNAALKRDPRLADAYFGFATASEELGDLEAALGAMRSYLHTEKNPDPYRLRVAQARSAIWEWEAKLGRGPWGPTRGIPPGFSAEELRRDGRGTAIKMPKWETKRPDGTMDYEIKAGDRFPELWKK